MIRRFRFSLRRLVVLVTLVCMYFGAWDLTKSYGVKRPIHDPRADSPTTFTFGDDCAPMPFVVRHGPKGYREYYFWLFGLKMRLPFQSNNSLKYYVHVQRIHQRRRVIELQARVQELQREIEASQAGLATCGGFRYQSATQN